MGKVQTSTMLETRGDVAEALSRRKGGNGIRSWYEVVDADLSAALALYSQQRVSS